MTAAHPPRGRRTLLALAALLGSVLPLAAAEAQRPSPTIALSVPGGPAGTSVTVRVEGLTPGLPIQLGFGGLSTNHEVMADGAADSQGNFELVVTIPDWVERHRTYYFFMAFAGQPPRNVSDPFIATAPDGFVRVAGSVSAVTAGCAQVRGFDQTVYTLLGETGALEAGARVVVEGTVGGPGEGTPSACSPGAAIPVRVRQVLPG